MIRKARPERLELGGVYPHHQRHRRLIVLLKRRAQEVPPAGIEPACPGSEPGVLPLDEGDEMGWPTGFEPAYLASQTSTLTARRRPTCIIPRDPSESDAARRGKRSSMMGSNHRIPHIKGVPYHWTNRGEKWWRRRDLHPQLRAYPDNPTRSVRSPKQGSALGIHGALIVKRLLRQDGQVDGVGKGFHPVSLQITITDGRSAQKSWARNRIRPTSRRR